MMVTSATPASFSTSIAVMADPPVASCARSHTHTHIVHTRTHTHTAHGIAAGGQQLGEDSERSAGSAIGGIHTACCVLCCAVFHA